MRFFFTLILLLTAHCALAWDLHDFGEEAASPVTTDAKYFFWSGIALTTLVVLVDDPIVDPFQQETASDRPLGHSSQWGDWLGQLVPNALYIGYYGIKGWVDEDEEAHRRAIGMFKATAYSTGVTTVLKYTIREPRPNDHHTKNSFPSGHTTSAFAFSGYVMAEHEYYIGIPALILSTFVGYSRINDNMHWLQDVIAGATIGFSYGWGISRLQKKHKGEGPTTMVTPILDSQTAGLALYREF
ncbi:MAG: phosphatase PAP2 family protein [Bacteriovoracaceae bacterium]